jgi:hypothetical protein
MNATRLEIAIGLGLNSYFILLPSSNISSIVGVER